MAILGTGTHTVVVQATTLTTAKSGADQVLIQFTDQHGDSITDYLPLTPKAWPYTLEKLKACGWNNETEIELLAADPSPIVGRMVEIVVAQEADANFQPRNRVKYYNKIGEIRAPREGQRSPGEIGARLRSAIGGAPTSAAQDKIPW